MYLCPCGDYIDHWNRSYNLLIIYRNWQNWYLRVSLKRVIVLAGNLKVGNQGCVDFSSKLNTHSFITDIYHNIKDK